jgi:hypothetical protein
MRQGLSAAVGIGALISLIGVFLFGALVALAVMSDLVGSGQVALAILVSVAVTVAAIVLASHQSRTATDTVSILSDWARSFGMALGGMVGGFQASFWIVALTLSLAEHRLLPEAVGSALLRESDRTSVLAWIWLVPQLSWIVPVALRIYRDGMARAVDAFRPAVFIGLCGGTVLSCMALVVLMLLGPPR